MLSYDQILELRGWSNCFDPCAEIIEGNDNIRSQVRPPVFCTCPNFSYHEYNKQHLKKQYDNYKRKINK